jgi:hypothetical protein
MPWPFSLRDFKFRRSQVIKEREAWVIGRSFEDTDAGLKKSALRGRTRGSLGRGGYWLQKLGVDKTKIIYVVDCKLGGVMELDALARRAAVPHLTGVVNGMVHLGRYQAEEEDLERGSGMWAAGKKWLSRTVSSGVELGGEHRKGRRGCSPRTTVESSAELG